MRVDELDYELPQDLIAQAPAEPRDTSRLLALPRRDGAPRHLRFADLPDLLEPGDLLVLNDSRVIPARLVGRKASGGRCEVLLVEPFDEPAGLWRVMGQASKALRSGSRLDFHGLAAEVQAAEGDGFYSVRFDRGGAALEEALERVGRVPLPPYIRREPVASDGRDYQTVVARAPGSVAAPTAGLHFTPALLDRLERHGVRRALVTLHVGPGTFLPVRTERLEDHRMHPERFDVPVATAEAFAEARARRSRVVAVGTTVVRALESAWAGGSLRPGPGRTEIFILPGFEFRAVDGLVTNFHLPRSTLLALVCAFAGAERVLAGYREAVAARYRFYSYGDAMAVL
ncbi:MAG TPA: tRNA preQ1(34) S-adenosylmethionine ribosyltransferase-isomerase QueA [Anaeromyxobacteraceae bacterium]|nr:tRNA preQ1(34) S-adenosylmethionine ribosyltransferase-isomerase QueA [Anaeromyxobacteraceae bacterium]